MSTSGEMAVNAKRRSSTRCRQVLPPPVGWCAAAHSILLGLHISCWLLLHSLPGMNTKQQSMLLAACMKAW
jgi:hypothetical protein